MTGEMQANLHPQILQQRQALALSALKELPNIGVPKPPYINVKQKPGEPYMQFKDRLKEAIEASPDLTPEARMAVSKDLAVMNANPQCQQILASLGKTASLAEMVEACSRLPMIQAETEKARIHANALAVALRPALKTGRGDRGSACYLCGEKGHMKRYCPKRNGQNRVNTERRAEKHSGVCSRCDKFGHLTKDCRSRFKKDGTPLPGNPHFSAAGRGAMTSQYRLIAAPAQVASQNSQQLQEGAQASIWPWEQTQQ